MPGCATPGGPIWTVLPRNWRRMTSVSPWLERATGLVAAAPTEPVLEELGRVESLGDGIAMVSGLPSARLDEVLRFQRGQLGFAQTLDRDLIGCVLLDDAGGIQA